MISVVKYKYQVYQYYLVEKVEKSIKVKEELYNRLNRYVGMLRVKERRPVSMNDAISELLKTEKRGDIMSFAGTWTMTDKEAEKMKKGISDLWKSWKR